MHNNTRSKNGNEVCAKSQRKKRRKTNDFTIVASADRFAHTCV